MSDFHYCLDETTSQITLDEPSFYLFVCHSFIVML